MDGVELFGLDVHRYRPQTSVSIAYLSLSVTSSTTSERDLGRRHTDNRDSDEMRIEEALADHALNLLRREAGSGKTTLLQWLAVNTARASFAGALAEWNTKVPFLVPLRSYTQRPLP